LKRVGHVAVLADLPITALEIAIDEVYVRRRDDLAHPRVLFAVDDIGLGRSSIVRGEQHVLDDILDFFNGRRSLDIKVGHHRQRPRHQSPRERLVDFTCRTASGSDGVCNFRWIERNLSAVPFCDCCQTQTRKPCDPRSFEERSLLHRLPSFQCYLAHTTCRYPSAV